MEICGIISNSGPNQEPLACGYKFGHKDVHSWATLPTFPFKDGDVLILGPECFISEDKKVISYQGENYYKSID